MPCLIKSSHVEQEKEVESIKNVLIDEAAQGYSAEQQTQLKQGILSFLSCKLFELSEYFVLQKSLSS